METNSKIEPVAASGRTPVIVPNAVAAAVVERDRLQNQLTQISALTDLVSHVESAADPQAACQALVDQLQQFLGVEQVLIGLCNRRNVKCELTAVSGVVNFHAGGELAVSAQSALQECIARGELVQWSVVEQSESGGGGLMAHAQFARLVGAAEITAAVLRDATGRVCGAWMLTGMVGEVHTEVVTGFLRASGAPVASALGLVKRGQKGRLQRAAENLRTWAGEKRSHAIMAAVALLGLMLCIPVHYHPTCDCTVEPVVRRFVAAPFAGPLEKSLVQTGDVVEKGQLLATIDGRELRMELSSTRADLHRATKQRAGHLAIHDSGESEVARYEVDSLQVRTELLEHREKNVDIRSPIAGVVVSGDLEDAEGMPLELGQTLFEIAPLEKMVVEVSIPEDDFAYVRPGMEVNIRLDAFPLRQFQAVIQRVQPRAELRDDANVFLAEVKLQDEFMGLRPGMRGTAKIQSDRYPIVWNWFRRPISAAIAWWGW